MRSSSRWWLALVLVLVGTVSQAKVGTFDEEPAATLLIPYVEVDLSSPTGRTTIVEVRAAYPTAALAHVTLWTDQGLPVLGFDVYLTGFDVQRFDVRDLLNGTLPATASVGQDPTNTISKKGLNSQDITFVSCDGTLPPAPLSATVTAGVRNAMTGVSSTALQGKCGGRAFGDDVARGFITVDTVNQCTQLHPNQPGYFGPGGTGVATFQNLLTGHFSYVDPAAKTTRSFSAAHLQATTTATSPWLSSSTGYTFYSRLIGSKNDQREPLGTAWTVPYRAGASVVAWRDASWPATAYDCGNGPAPLSQHSLFLFDQQEVPTDLTSLAPFPASAGRVRVGSLELPDTNRAGLVTLNGGFGPGQPRQLWLGSLETAEAGEFATGVVGTPSDNAAQPAGTTPGWPESADYPVTSLGAMDRSPASTLLLPYFEVDLDDPNGSNTLVRFGTGASSSVLVNVTLWTDLGVPTRSFPVYLTGYDQAELDLRLLFSLGTFHRSASAGQDPQDLISPRSPFSQDINYASCNGRLPLGRLKADELTALKNAHLGKPVASFGGKCAGSDRGDRLARGYVTLDQVFACTPSFPNAPGYGNEALETRNLLVGDWAITNRAAKTLYGERMVPIHARPPGHPALTAGMPTFYGRFNSWAAIDRREALGTLWEVPFDDTGSGKTSLVVWREPDATAAPFTCGMTPPGQPGAHGSAVAFDEQETVTTLSGEPFSRVSTMIAVGAGGLDVPYTKGVLQFDLQGGAGGPPGDAARRGGVVLALRRDTTGGTSWVQNGHPVPIDYPTPAKALIEVSQPEGFIRAGAGSASFKVRLSQAPTAPVTITFASSNGLTLSPNPLVLNAVNIQGATVTISGAGSTCPAPVNNEVTIGVSASSTDLAFNAFDPNDVAVYCSP